MSNALKRGMDALAAALALTALLPLLLLIAAAVRVRLGSPVLFRQQRPGRYGRPFTMIKFRTMRDAVDERGNRLPDAARLTRLGAFLRQWSLDELPQLWHVLRGEMSLVGPRPLLMEYLPRYTGDQSRRHEVRPGLTGWSQVNGRNQPSWQRRLELDVWYVEHRSLWLDLRILLLTIPVLLRRTGVSAPGHVTVEPFMAERVEASDG